MPLILWLPTVQEACRRSQDEHSRDPHRLPVRSNNAQRLLETRSAFSLTSLLFLPPANLQPASPTPTQPQPSFPSTRLLATRQITSLNWPSCWARKPRTSRRRTRSTTSWDTRPAMTSRAERRNLRRRSGVTPRASTVPAQSVQCWSTSGWCRMWVS